MYMLML